MAALKPEPAWWWAEQRRCNAGRYAGVVGRVEAGLRRYGPDARAYKLIGRAHWGLGRKKLARRAWERALRLDPDSLWAFHESAGRLYSRGRAAAALKLVSRSLEEEGESAWALALCAELRRVPQLGQKGRAVADLRQAVKAAPRRAWPRAFLARAIGGEEGLVELDRAAALDPSCGWIRAWRGEARRLAGRLREAAVDLDAALILDPGCAVARTWRGCVRLQLADYAGAAEDFTAYIVSEETEAARWRSKSRNHQPAYALAYALRAVAKARLGAHEGVFADMERAAALQPRHGWREGERLGMAREALLDDLERLEREPGSRGRARGWAGEYLLSVGDWARALALLGDAVAAEPRWGEARAWRAEALVRLGRTSEGLAEAERAVRLSPLCARAYAWRGLARRGQGELAAAARDLRRCGELDGTAAWAFARLGEILLEQGRTRRAVEVLERAVALDGRSAEARACLEAARAKNRMIEPVPADGLLDEALARSSRRYPVRSCVHRGEFYFAVLHDGAAARPRGSDGAFLARLDRILRAAPSAGAFAARALLRWRSRNGPDVVRINAKASRDIARALALDPADPRLHQISGVFAHASRQYRRCAAAYTAAVALDRSRTLSWLLLAEGLHAVNDARSVAAFDCAVKFEPGSAWAYALRGRAKSPGSGAIPDLDRAIALRPGWGWLHAWRGHAKLLLGDAAGAMRDLTNAARLDDSYDRTYVWRGLLRLKNGRLLQAKEDLSRAISLEDNYDLSHFALGRVLSELGDTRGALRVMRRGCAINMKETWDWGINDGKGLSGLRRDAVPILEKIAGRQRWARVWLAQAYLLMGEPDRRISVKPAGGAR